MVNIFFQYNELYSADIWHSERLTEWFPAFTVFFQPFRSAKDFPAAILTDTNGNEDRNVLNLATATFRVDTIYVNIRIGSGEQTGMLGLDMFISLFVRVADGSREHFYSPMKLQ